MTFTSKRGTGALTRIMTLLLVVLAMMTSADGTKKHRRKAPEGKQLSPSPRPEVGQLADVARWRTPTFDFAGNQTKEQQYRTSGRYDPASILILDADLIGGRVYVTTPLFKSGSPASYSVANSTNVQEPSLQPFPSWEAHATTADSLTNCSTQMVSVFRSTRLWSDENTVYLIDSGVIDVDSTFQKLCPPKIVTLDIPSARILNTTVIDKESCNSLYIAIQVEQLSDGRRVAYIADSLGFAITVIDLFRELTHRVTSEYYYPTPGLFITTIAGVRSYLTDGIFNVAVAEGNLYSWAFASTTLNKVATSTLRDFYDQDVVDLTVETLVPGRRAGPSGAFAVDRPGKRMFFGIAEQEALYCWNMTKPFQQRNFRLLSQNTERYQFFSGIKVSPSNDQLLVVTDRYHKFGQNIVDEESINYRVMTMNITNLKC